MPTYTNLFTNPRPIDTTGWTSSQGTGGTATPTILTTAGGPTGGQARRMTWTVAGTGGLSGHVFGSGTTVAATAGATYSIAFYIRASKVIPVTPRIQWIDSGAAVLSSATGSETTLVANTWTYIEFEGAVAPASTAFLRGNAYATTGTTWAVGDTLDCQTGTIVQGATVPEAFHGSMTDTSTNDYSWTGTTDASTSTLVVTESLAVPTGLAATAVSGSQIDVSWNPVASATGYDGQGISITVGQDLNTIDWSLATTLFTGLAATSYSDTGLPPQQRRAYRVRSAGS